MISFCKSLLIAALMSLVMSPVQALDEDGRNIYLVRHAEKQMDAGRNPGLTEQGQQRTAWLVSWFRSKELKAVLSSDFRRTMETAGPIANAVDVPVLVYDPRDLQGVVGSLKALKGNLLVVGHSNTTPALASILSGQDFPYLGEEAHSEIYIVRIAADGKTDVTIEHSTAGKD